MKIIVVGGTGFLGAKTVARPSFLVEVKLS